MSEQDWRIETMSGGSRTITHPYIAVAPGCPTERHPTRECGCKVFRTTAAAEEYIAERRDAAEVARGVAVPVRRESPDPGDLRHEYVSGRDLDAAHRQGRV